MRPSDAILGAMLNFQSKTGIRVRAIYLGRKENDEFEKEMSGVAMVPYREGELRPKRRTFNGAEVFTLLDETSHLGVSG